MTGQEIFTDAYIAAIRAALQVIAQLPMNERTMEGQEDAYRAVEKLIPKENRLVYTDDITIRLAFPPEE
jgi:hypothetical protein